MGVDLLELIRQERRRRGWSMRAAAAAAGVSNTTWSRMEAGAVEITPAMSRHIADAFGWPDDWETNPESLVATLSHPLSTVDAEQLLERIRAELAEHEQRIAAMVAQLMKGNDGSAQEGRVSRSSESVDGASAARTAADSD